jgi:hypothetical protein
MLLHLTDNLTLFYMRFTLEQGLKLKLAVYEVAGRIRLTDR